MNNNKALKEHYLSSLLPYFNNIEKKQVTKSRQFFKPEEFIWNNPHRTSNKIYPYYHHFNDQYLHHVQPKIKQLQEQDRMIENSERIRKLSLLREQTRQKFFCRQKERETLQLKSDNRRRQYSTLDMREDGVYLKSRTGRQKINYPLLRKATQKIQNTYKESVQNHDNKMNTIRDMISQQIKKNQSNIRNQFQKQKKANQTTNSNIKKKSRVFKNT